MQRRNIEVVYLCNNWNYLTFIIIKDEITKGQILSQLHGNKINVVKPMLKSIVVIKPSGFEQLKNYTYIWTRCTFA